MQYKNYSIEILNLSYMYTYNPIMFCLSGLNIILIAVIVESFYGEFSECSWKMYILKSLYILKLSESK